MADDKPAQHGTPREHHSRAEAEPPELGEEFEEDEEEELEGSTPNPAEAFSQVIERCKAANIDVEELEDVDGDRYLRIGLPSGREKRLFTVRGNHDARVLLASPFERYRFVSGYDAFCSYEDSFIEAGVRAAGTGLTPPSFAFSRIFGSRPRFGTQERWPRIRILREGDEEGEGEAIDLGPSSDVAAVLLGAPARRGVAVRISGRNFATNDQARRVLESYTDSLFFQVDAKLGVAIGLRRERRRRVGPRRRRPENELGRLEYPRYICDRDPMSLYWYGRGATGMPLLQFLAYYQVMEFYFPVYAQEEVRRRLRNIVKDPGFDAHRERDIGRLVEVVSSAGGRNVWGDERSQLRVTLRACVDVAALRELISVEDYAAHFERKIEGLTKTTLRASASDDELVTRTADRIYEIRCRIVHTKEGGGGEEVGLLLPFSPEADRLDPDIEVAEFIARRVLAAAARPIANL